VTAPSPSKARPFERFQCRHQVGPSSLLAKLSAILGLREPSTETLADPVFIAGPVTINHEESGIETVPEPATLLLSGIGIAALTICQRRKSKAK